MLSAQYDKAMEIEDDYLEISMPADPQFVKSGSMAVACLAVRLGFDSRQLDELSNLAFQILESLQGKGFINISCKWESSKLFLEFDNHKSSKNPFVDGFPLESKSIRLVKADIGRVTLNVIQH